MLAVDSLLSEGVCCDHWISMLAVDSLLSEGVCAVQGASSALCL